MAEQKFLTMRETCARLGVTRQTVYNLYLRGKLIRYTRGFGRRHTLFDAREVDALSEITAAAVEIGENAHKRAAKARRGSGTR